jgi:hypothetical protein
VSLTPQPILLHLKDRLRANYVDDALWSDEDILSIFNDAYQDVCEQSQCLQSFMTLSLVAHQSEYSLPSDFDQLLLVVAGGSQLQPMPLSESLLPWISDGLLSGYYLFGKPGAMTIGVIPAPIEDDTTMVQILYSASPTLFTTFGDGLDSRYPIEFADLLVHYARWRVQMMSGGAERIQNATTDRGIYDKRVIELRRTANTVGSSVAPSQMTHVSDRRRVLGNARRPTG